MTLRALIAIAALAGSARARDAVVDSVSPVFRSDSAQAATIRSIEAGNPAHDSSTLTLARADSLAMRLKHRGPYVGLSAGVSFADNSAKRLFSDYMLATAQADSQRILQGQDPVQVYFPVGLVVGYPVFRYLDAWLRTEHYWYRVTGLAQRNNEPTREFWYALQGHLVGVGARYLVPVSLLSVDGRQGLYAAYTRFWSFGPTGLYSPAGSLRAQTDPAGAGYEVQLGLQQNFDKRWALTGGLSFSRLTFASKAGWSAVVPGATDAPAEWTLQAMRLAFQGIYQFGK